MAKSKSKAKPKKAKPKKSSKSTKPTKKSTKPTKKTKPAKKATKPKPTKSTKPTKVTRSKPTKTSTKPAKATKATKPTSTKILDEAAGTDEPAAREADAAFVQAILAAPDDDGPRLVYADVLQERGDPRGEFIAIQCELAREKLPTLDAVAASDLEHTDPRYTRIATLLQRELELWRDHNSDWLYDDESSADIIYVRGFAGAIEFKADEDLARLGIAFERAPITSVEITKLEASQLAELAATPGLAQLDRLVLDFVEDTPADASALAPVLAATPRLRKLVLRNVPLDPSVLAACPALVHLEALAWTSGALAALLALPIARQLEYLHVPSSALEEFLATPRLPALRGLAIELSEEHSGALWTSIVKSPHLETLETFVLWEAMPTNARFAELVTLRAPRLRTIRIGLDEVAPETGRAFLDAHPTLRRLELWGGFDVDGWVRMLAESPASTNLRALSLHSRPAPDALATIFRSPHFANLRALELREDFTDEAFAAVAANPRPALVKLLTSLFGRQAIPGLPNVVRRNNG